MEGVGDLFRKYMERLKPELADYFSFEPVKPYDAAPLPEALESTMTFGFYQEPMGEQKSGIYYYNGANLTRNMLANVAALNYHELVPGHHFHITTQRNNNALHPLSKNAFFNAFNEGWAEYAATLAGEMGCYEEPEERFGRLMMDAFLTCRLVVDTGMNVLGWSLEKARDYMREYSTMPEAEILTETVRYSCDIPGQSLAYKLGDTQILNLRKKMQDAQGDKFDIREFHNAVLTYPGLPLADLEYHIDHVIKRNR